MFNIHVQCIAHRRNEQESETKIEILHKILMKNILKITDRIIFPGGINGNTQ